MSNAGPAIVFVCLLLLTGILGMGLFAYAAYCFLLVVQQTAAGVDEVEWPSDPLPDKLPSVAYVVCLLALWVAPAGIIARVDRNNALGDSPLLTFFAASVLILWALFPISLFSSLSAGSAWIVFRLTVLRFFARCPGAVLVFYLVSGLLAAATMGLLYLAFLRGQTVLFFVAPPVAFAGFFIYARLLGRLAWLFDQSGARREGRAATSEPRTGAKQSSRQGLSPAKPGKKTQPTASHDPWAIPGEEPQRRQKKRRKRSPASESYAMADPEAWQRPEEERPKTQQGPQVKGYGLSAEEPPPRPKEVPLDGFIPVGYDAVPLEPAAPDDASALQAQQAQDLATPSDFETRLVQRPTDLPAPNRPLVSGVYTFPFYPSTARAWILLSVGGIVVCWLIQWLKFLEPR
jgi:hypothetical protein